MAGMEEEEYCTTGESGEGGQRKDGSILDVGEEKTHPEDIGSEGGRRGGRRWSGMRILNKGGKG
jgi:hypothetical protein